MDTLIYLLFFCSGVTGLVYQVVWVREFGYVFGNTVYSASLVIAVFMLGLGVGSYAIGAWADRVYAARSMALLRLYALLELLVAGLGFGISLVIPRLGAVSALASSYAADRSGWYVLSVGSYAARTLIAVALLTPITLLMGGTLTVLIRRLVRQDLTRGSARIAVLYGVNTAGAALGCFLTDFSLIPAFGLRGTQLVAVGLNVFVAFAALLLTARPEPAAQPRSRRPAEARAAAAPAPSPEIADAPTTLVFTSLALALSGFGALGAEILWFRHFTLLLGGFRAVFSLLLTIILLGIGAGSLAGAVLVRRTTRPARWLMATQGAFVAAMLLGLTMTDVPGILAAGSALAPGFADKTGFARAWTEQWLNGLPMLLEVGFPALLMGFTFPLANAVIQHAERSVGRRAGLLYLANTIGAVCGSLVCGFLLLPALGIQGSATILAIASGLAIVPLHLVDRSTSRHTPGAGLVPLTTSMLVAGVAVVVWLLLPATYVVARAQMPAAQGERVLTMQEGVNEVITIADVPGEGLQLLTNGHPMSSTNPMSQRYMRALAHIPLLSMAKPESVLVIGFGVGETVHAATLHPTVTRVEVADLSKAVLQHARYFRDTNKNVLDDPRVVVYVNDGRQHLRMQSESSYDLITLEPPPIALSGVGALYSEEFYRLARSRLKAKGYISQWLPAYQVPAETTRSLVRAFVDVFPQAVLLSGADAELLLVGTNDVRIDIDPARLTAALASAPAVAADLRRLDLGTPREIVGTFVGGPATLAAATRGAVPVTDDMPLQEYGARSRLSSGRNGVPASLFDLTQVTAWCPACTIDGRPAPAVEGLDAYLALLDGVYKRSPLPAVGPGSLSDARSRTLIEGSAYLNRLLDDPHEQLGIAHAAAGEFPQAIEQFRAELRRSPGSAKAHWNLGDALAAAGSLTEGIAELRRSIELDPTNTQAAYDLGTTLLEAKDYRGAADAFRLVLKAMPQSAEAHNNLGVALASSGRLDEALAEFQQAVGLQPQFADAQRNLAATRGARRTSAPPVVK